MNKTLLSLLIILLLPMSLMARESHPTRQITVYGESFIQVEPDITIWSISVQNRGKDVSLVASLHSKQVSLTIDELLKAGVKQDWIQTSNMSFQENWVYTNNTRIKEGYIASTSITFKLNDLTTYLELWQTLANLSDVSINNVGYQISEPVRHQEVAQVMALENAKTKAEQLTHAMQVSIGNILLIEELRGNAPQPQMMAMEAQIASRSASPIAPGTITISAQVKVIYELIN